jgi:UTP--glucose-1-phosphate uridylyltransferase
MTDPFDPFRERMQAEGLPDVAIQTFKHYYDQLVAGHSGLIAEHELSPVAELDDADALGSAYHDLGQSVLDQSVVIKLNGGLGTGMGLEKAKSLLPVKDGLSFLDIIAGQAAHSAVPLVLMNSFATQADSLAALKKYPQLQDSPVGLDFLQHKVPKISRERLAPADWAQAPHLTWCPPGHGDIYTALLTSSVLAALLAAGRRYAFVSNADNLGAVLDPAILGYFVQHEYPFLMEVADRTEADKKGGHLAIRQDNQLILRESAQCPPDDLPSFQDISKHRFFNTNNLWIDLEALNQVLAQNNNILGLPMILNEKTVDPRDPQSLPVYQLETAMGSAIAIFEGAQVLRVPRRRFAPVKTTSDLLAVRSDAYTLTGDSRIVPHADLAQIPVISLDSSFYKLVDDLDLRFPGGSPSLRDCVSLDIVGDVHIAAGVVLTGRVRLENQTAQPMRITSGSITDQAIIWDQ